MTYFTPALFNFYIKTHNDKQRLYFIDNLKPIILAKKQHYVIEKVIEKYLKIQITFSTIQITSKNKTPIEITITIRQLELKNVIPNKGK